MESNQIFEINERGVLTKYHEREEVQEITTADGVAEIHIRLTQITIPKGVVEIGAKAFERVCIDKWQNFLFTKVLTRINTCKK